MWNSIVEACTGLTPEAMSGRRALLFGVCPRPWHFCSPRTETRISSSPRTANHCVGKARRTLQTGQRIRGSARCTLYDDAHCGQVMGNPAGFVGAIIAARTSPTPTPNKAPAPSPRTPPVAALADTTLRTCALS